MIRGTTPDITFRHAFALKGVESTVPPEPIASTSRRSRGLIAKRAEVAGQITHLDAEMRRLRTALEHLDAAIVAPPWT